MKRYITSATKIYEKYPERSQISFEDDMVKVFNKDGQEIYSGMEDYEPMKYDDWRWDSTDRVYRLDGYIKVCI